MRWRRGAAFESSSAIGRGTKWSVAGEAVWRDGWGCSGAPWEGDVRLPGTAEEQALCGGQTASPAGARQSSSIPLIRRYWPLAKPCTDGDHRRRVFLRETGDILSYGGNTLRQQSGAEADGCLLDALHTSGGVYPARSVEELQPGITTAEPYRGGLALCGLLVRPQRVTANADPPGGHKAAGLLELALYVDAGDAGGFDSYADAERHFWGGDPGAKLLPAASDRAEQTENGDKCFC